MKAVEGPEQKRIQSMFGAIAHRYDRANDLLSVGIHRIWRKQVVRAAAPQRTDRVLDCATGTGDLAIAFAEAIGPGAHVVGTDFCSDMIAYAPGKAQRAGCSIRFEVADVTSLPYPDASFEIACIAFGIRNVTDPVQGLREMLRVLSHDGRLVVLEFGQPNLFGLRALYDLYANTVLPRLGGWVTGHREAYEYLQSSSRAFPCREAFVEMVRAAGPVASVEYRSLTGGIAYIYKATKG